jgi:hypothetical protein
MSIGLMRIEVSLSSVAEARWVDGEHELLILNITLRKGLEVPRMSFHCRHTL